MSTIERPPEQSTEPRSDLADYHALLREQPWAAISRRATLFAHRLMRKKSWEAAEDVAQQATLVLFDPSRRRWERSVHADVFDALAPIVVGLVSNRRQKHGNRREISHENLEDAERSSRVAPRDARTPEATVAKAERARVVMERLRARVADDVVAREVVTLLEEGVDGREGQAQALGRSIEEIKNARRRITNHLAIIDRDLDDDETEDRRG